MADNENGTGVQPAENTPTQTLFRFVSLRSPQLSDDKEQNKRFVLIPEGLKNDNAFYIPVTTGTGSKQRLLKERAEIYTQNTDCISDINDIKTNYKVVYDFATWLARNKSTTSFQALSDERDRTLTDPNYANPDAIMLWNNLIYQVVTQKDFYIKETVMQMLLALHILQNAVTTENESKTLLAARIALPKELMLDDEALPASQSASRMGKDLPKETFPSEEMKKQQVISTAKIKLSRINALNKNLVIAEKQYNKEYQDEYKSQDEAYQTVIAPLIAEYNEAVADAKDAYCEVRPPGEEYDPQDPCRQPKEVPYPVLPKFEFSFREEVSGESLVSSLKPENIETLLDILGYDFNPESVTERNTEEDISNLDSLLEGRNTFAEITSLIAETVEHLNNTIIENTEDNSQIYTSIGGVIIPLARTVTVPFTYQLCPKYIYKGYTLDLALNVPDSSWDVAGISYSLIPGNSSTSIDKEYFVKSRAGDTIFLNDLYSPGLDFYTIQDSTLTVKVVFTNGRIAVFTVPGVTVRTCISSGFELEIEEGEPPVIIDDEKDFIPSGFGFKQIGIADYLKVEQSTHAYVEGEVAHIENVMAREYREKSTRRLRRSENTTTESFDTEREQLSDTTTANRFEMQNEISKIMQEASDRNMQFGVSAGYRGGGFNVNTSLGMGSAHHSSKEDSVRQAMTQAQDITSRAMDRIVTKVHEERIEKIIEEFEENNSHGLDNRKGDKHVVGVYRWVDKLLKNQIYNYGKRMMFEFMIPEPAKLHSLGMKNSKSVDQIDLKKPIDPREEGSMQITNYSALADENKLKYWISKYNVEIEVPLNNLILSKSYSEAIIGENEVFSKTETVEVPDGYIATHAFANGHFKYDHDNRQYHSFGVAVGQHIYCVSELRADGSFGNIYYNLDNVSKSINISYHSTNYHAMSIGVNIHCKLSDEARKTWQQKTFNSIINAYEEALIEYNNKLSEEQNKAVVIRDSNPNFYRQIENTILRKNCISYMADRTIGSTRGYGLAGLTTGTTFKDYETNLTSRLDKYTAFVKFMEQAFEWENLSYYLYPFYWGNKQNWEDLYQAENTDPLFRTFLQSGMARVIVTVRPGFEDAVQFYLATGKIWNGGEVPVIGDELYLSIVDEMKEPKGVKQGKAWLTRLPTTLNILQAESIGLKVAHALPFTTENPDEFEIPSEVITEDKFNFEKNDHLLGNQTDDSSERIISGDWV